jgi:hypothetical protein
VFDNSRLYFSKIEIMLLPGEKRPHGVFQVVMGWRPFTYSNSCSGPGGSAPWRWRPGLPMSRSPSFGSVQVPASAMSMTSMVPRSTRCASRARMRLIVRKSIHFACTEMDPVRRRIAAVIFPRLHGHRVSSLSARPVRG